MCPDLDRRIGEQPQQPKATTPPQCASMRASAHGSLCESRRKRNRLPVVDSEAPKLPIHTAIAVPQYGTQGSLEQRATVQGWCRSPLADLDRAIWIKEQPPDPSPEAQPRARSVGSPVTHCPVASQPPAVAAIVRPYAAACARSRSAPLRTPQRPSAYRSSDRLSPSSPIATASINSGSGNVTLDSQGISRSMSSDRQPRNPSDNRGNSVGIGQGSVVL